MLVIVLVVDSYSNSRSGSFDSSIGDSISSISGSSYVCLLNC